jgi:hypothetical protein
MPVGKYFTFAGSALLALLFVLDACFGDHSSSRFDASLFDSAHYAPRIGEIAAAREFRFARDVTPASRVKDVFAQFVPSEARRGKRQSPPIIIVR